MFLCPKCADQLARYSSPHGQFWGCTRCRGRAVNLTVLRKSALESAINAIWLTPWNEPHRRIVPCPCCRQPMCLVKLDAGGNVFPVDVCRNCQFVWFDADEFESLPPPAPPRRDEDLAPELQARLAELKAASEASRQEAFTTEAEGPTEPWRVVAAYLGLPVEVNNPIKNRPWATWTLAAVVVTVSVIALRFMGFGFGLFDDGGGALRFAFTPADPWRLGGFTWISAFFLHAGLLHLLGNVYFLLVFGDNVEEVLGWRRFLLLVLTATLAGDALHLAFDSRPCIGASGGLSGLIAFYALQFPKARLAILWRWFHPSPWMVMPAWIGFGGWVLLQSAGVWMQMSGFSNVSALAHLGGAGTGVLWWLALRRQQWR